MRRIWPGDGATVDLEEVDALIAAEARPRPADRPWLAVNMVTSLDGATAVAGLSRPLQGPADKAVFIALRAAADVVLAGAGTVRDEHYGPARLAEVRREARRARGQADVPAIAVVTASLQLDPDARLFTDAEARTIVITCERSDADRRRALGAVADVAVCGGDRVEARLALEALGERGADFVLCEGGPRLNGDLIAADVIDEWCLTISPLLAGGDSRRASIGIDPAQVQARRLDRAFEDDGMLLLRYVR